MIFKNVLNYSVTLKTKEGMVTLQPNETHDFPDWYYKHPALEEVGKKEVSKLDLNNDGKVDKKDASLASKVLNSIKKKKKSKK